MCRPNFCAIDAVFDILQMVLISLVCLLRRFSFRMRGGIVNSLNCKGLWFNCTKEMVKHRISLPIIFELSTNRVQLLQ